MGREELTLTQLIKAGGRFFELGRAALSAALSAGATVEEARLLWKEDFQSQVAQVLVGTHKIVLMEPHEIARSSRRPFVERLAAVENISDQTKLLEVATDLGLSEHVRRKAFLHVIDEEQVAKYAVTLEHGDQTDSRLLTMQDRLLLYYVATNAESIHAGLWAAKALINVAPKDALLIAVTHENVCGPNTYRYGLLLAEEITDQTLLEAVRDDSRAHPEVVAAAQKRLEKLRES